MALVYYPKGSVLYVRDTQNTNGLYEQLALNCSPDMVLYFDTSSVVNALSSSLLVITLSSSYASTSSVALNALNAVSTGNSSSYSTILTSSTNWITASFSGSQTQWVNITQSGSYSFTASNIPQPGNSQSADVLVYINNTATQTSSLLFPSSWVNVASTWPTYITSSRNAVVWLKAFDNNTIIGTCNIQL
jgi:hypothetical protein